LVQNAHIEVERVQVAFVQQAAIHLSQSRLRDDLSVISPLLDELSIVLFLPFESRLTAEANIKGKSCPQLQEWVGKAGSSKRRGVYSTIW
jgi:hypothetical protein